MPPALNTKETIAKELDAETWLNVCGEEAEKDGGATRIKVPLEPPIVYLPIRKEGSEVVRSEGESDESFRKRVLAASTVALAVPCVLVARLAGSSLLLRSGASFA